MCEVYEVCVICRCVKCVRYVKCVEYVKCVRCVSPLRVMRGSLIRCQETIMDVEDGEALWVGCGLTVPY